MKLTPPSGRRPTDAAVIEFLGGHHGAEPTNLEVLRGGFWSAAFGYRVKDDEFVLRVADTPDGFRADELAMRYTSPALPVPEVLAIGDAFGRSFAISRRHYGRFLEEVGPEEADSLGPTVVQLLAGLRAVPDSADRSGATQRRSTARDPRPLATTGPTMNPVVVVAPWRDWLLDALTDRPDHHMAGWRMRIAADPVAERAFVAADRRIRSLLDACPDRRELVHSDLLHFNVLVTPAADAVTAVFSWKCATWGDAIYDLAWCTFWGRWHAGIAAINLWDRVVPTLSASDAVDVGVRHHAYELHVGATHLAWFATVGDLENLSWTRHQLDELLERGPLG